MMRQPSFCTPENRLCFDMIVFVRDQTVFLHKMAMPNLYKFTNI